MWSGHDLDIIFQPYSTEFAEPPSTHPNQFKNAFLANVFSDLDL